MAHCQRIHGNPWFYARDITENRFPWSGEPRDRNPHSGVNGKDLPWMTHKVRQAPHSFHGITYGHSLTGFAPFDASKAVPATATAALGAMDKEKFALIVAAGEWHVSLMSGGTVYEAHSGLTTSSSVPALVPGGFASWVKTYDWKPAQIGTVLMPPDATGMGSYKKDFEAFIKTSGYPKLTLVPKP